MYADLNQKTCSKCNLTLSFSMFSKDKKRKDGLCPWCKNCKQESDRKFYLKNSKMYKDKASKWKKLNPEKLKISNSKYKKNNKEKVNLDTQKYKAKNRGVTNANTAKRRAAVMQRTPKWLTKEHLEQIKVLYIEAARIQRETGIEMHVDHILPLQGENVSGLHVPWNMQILPGRLNEAKKNKV